MSDLSAYSVNGVYRFENFQQLLTQNDLPNFPRFPIGSAGGVDGWYITLKVVLLNNERYVYPLIYCHNTKPTLLLNPFFNIIKKDGSSVFKTALSYMTTSGFGSKGLDMIVTAVLDGSYEYLDDNGGLTVEYGLHVDAIQGSDGIWKFNFNEKLFDTNKSLSIEYTHAGNVFPEVFYGHKQLLRFHSPFFQNQLTWFQSRGNEKLSIEQCLQIAHGVRAPLDRSCLAIARIALNNELRNVVQYVDQHLVQVYWCPKMKSYNHKVFDSCVEYGLRHYLAHLVRHFECLEDLEDMIQKLDIQKMSGEVMKMFVAKIFEFET